MAEVIKLLLTRCLCESVAVRSHVQVFLSFMNKEESEARGKVVICRDAFAEEYGHRDVFGPSACPYSAA